MSTPTSVTYEIEEAYCLELADHIRSLGYHAHIYGYSDSSAPYIPLFVSAGLGQLGAYGQLLSPHCLMVIITDAPVIHDEPIDYAINQSCEKCQVCVNRCPSNALAKDKAWWRGAKKNKISYKWCRLIMGRYDGCAICMKTCPPSQPARPVSVEGQSRGSTFHEAKRTPSVVGPFRRLLQLAPLHRVPETGSAEGRSPSAGSLRMSLRYFLIAPFLDRNGARGMVESVQHPCRTMSGRQQFRQPNFREDPEWQPTRKTS